MPMVLQMTRILDARPAPVAVPGLSLRTFAGAEDVELWLDLRRRAFARERFGVRDWNAADFAREFLEKPWWRPERMWFAVPERGLLDHSPSVVGTVTLASRTGSAEAKPVVHWLAVLATWRRRNVGRLLMNAVEAACWEAGDRQVWLETHAAWTAAVKFYESLGYQAVAPGE